MSTLENNTLITNTPNEDNDTKEINDIDELLICKDNCVLFLFFTFPFIPVFFILTSIVGYKDVIILDGKNKQIISCSRNIYGCRIFKKFYDFFQIKKVKIFTSSISDPIRPFNKIYFINCDIYSNDNDKATLFHNIPYDLEKFNEFSIIFKKYVDTEVEPLETQKIVSDK